MVLVTRGRSEGRETDCLALYSGKDGGGVYTGQYKGGGVYIQVNIRVEGVYIQVNIRVVGCIYRSI